MTVTLKMAGRFFFGTGLFLFAVFSAIAQELPGQLKGHGGPIKAITISPDGERVLTASFDYSILYWDITAPEAEIIHRLEGHDAAVNDVVFLNGKKRAVSVSDDGTLGIWDLETGKLIIRIDAPHDKVLDVAVSNNGTLAAVARWDETVRIYDLIWQKEIAVLEGHRGNVNGVVFSHDDRFLYSAAYDGQILEWEVDTGRFVRPVHRHGWGINSIALLDENRILYGALDGTVAVVSILEAQRIQDIAKRERPIQSVKVSPDGALAAFGDGAGQIHVFASTTGKKIEGDEVTFGPVWDFDFVSGTNQIYHVGLDDFASRWQISPRKLNQNRAELPRRFQVRNSDDPGELEFQRKCSVCHTLIEDGANRAGPTLFKVFGRRAGTLPGYKYSKALIESDIIWNEETIGRLFDDGPDKVVPGTKMPVQRLKQIERRDDLIQFLKEATAPKE
ncbi:MAG: cytochrome C [Pseudomonadota bacterium]